MSEIILLILAYFIFALLNYYQQYINTYTILAMDNRLVYRVFLKLLFIVGLVVLLFVFFNSLFVTEKEIQKSIVLGELDVTDMRVNEIRKTRWNGKEVAVLLRAEQDYFVYFNTGDSGNCPLFKEPDGFKDTCTSTRFDFHGKQKGSKAQGFTLNSPPHYFKEYLLLIGEALE